MRGELHGTIAIQNGSIFHWVYFLRIKFCFCFIYKKNGNIFCKDSICNDPKMVLSSYVKGPNNIICRAWV